MRDQDLGNRVLTSSPVCPDETIRSRLIKDSDGLHAQAQELRIPQHSHLTEIMLSEHPNLLLESDDSREPP